jgi:branched-chain amino acid aminotransferase
MAGFKKAQFIWMNGKLVPWDSASVHVSAHALQYGTGVFEGMRSYATDDGPAIFRLHDHLRRLEASAAHYEIELPFSVDVMAQGALDVVRENKLESSYLRPIAFFDSFSFAVWPKECPVTVAIIAVPGQTYIASGPEQGVRVTVSTTRRIDPSTLPPHVKACGHYTNSVRAAQEALRKGFNDAILLNTRGDVAEGSGANLFLVKSGTLITNDIDASILMGITRVTVLQLARDLGIPIEIRRMTEADLASADEMFFSGTAVEVTPVREVDGRPVGDGKPGSITKRLQSVFYEAVHGRLSQYHHWLSFVKPGAKREMASV